MIGTEEEVSGTTREAGESTATRTYATSVDLSVRVPAGAQIVVKQEKIVMRDPFGNVIRVELGPRTLTIEGVEGLEAKYETGESLRFF